MKLPPPGRRPPVAGCRYRSGTDWGSRTSRSISRDPRSKSADWSGWVATRSVMSWMNSSSAYRAVIGSLLWLIPSSGELPIDPRAHRAAHDELEVAPREPRQLLGEHRHALAPRARHAGDVGATEHALGAGGVIDAAERVVDVPVGIRRARVARRAGRLDGDVRTLGEREHRRQARPRRVVLGAGGPAEVIDDQLQLRMARRDLVHLWKEVGG